MGAFTKERLQKYLDLRQEIDNQLERLERMISAMTSPSAQSLDDMPHGGSGSNDKIGSALGRAEALKKKIVALMDREADEYWLIDSAIERVEHANQRLVLRCRYLDRYSWGEVCAVLFGEKEDYNEKFDNYLRTTYRIHGNALVCLTESNKKAIVSKDQ